jgi:hypothetical protein
MDWGGSVFRLRRISRRDIVGIFSHTKFYAIPQVHFGLHAALKMFLTQLNVLNTFSERRKQGFGGETWGKEAFWKTQA